MDIGRCCGDSQTARVQWILAVRCRLPWVALREQDARAEDRLRQDIQPTVDVNTVGARLPDQHLFLALGLLDLGFDLDDPVLALVLAIDPGAEGSISTIVGSASP
jgi:hypothetical protein